MDQQLIKLIKEIKTLKSNVLKLMREDMHHKSLISIYEQAIEKALGMNFLRIKPFLKETISTAEWLKNVHKGGGEKDETGRQTEKSGS